MQDIADKIKYKFKVLFEDLQIIALRKWTKKGILFTPEIRFEQESHIYILDGNYEFVELHCNSEEINCLSDRVWFDESGGCRAQFESRTHLFIARYNNQS